MPFPAHSAWLAKSPIAHRGLHDPAAGRFENTLSAAQAAVDQGFAIEVDLHPAADGVPVVFHDHTLERLTARQGELRELASAELGEIGIGGTADTIPTLRQLLDLVGGRVGLVLELKGNDGPGQKDTPHAPEFAASVASVLEGYSGPAAVMSFDHRLVRDMRQAFADRPVGLTAWGDEDTGAIHRAIVEETRPDFISYYIKHIGVSFVRDFRASGRPVISWTIRSPEQAAESALHADQITFECFDPR